MKQHAHLLILTIMFLTSCSDDTEVMKQESSPPSLTEKAPTYRTKENAIIEVELFIKNNRNNTRNSSFLNYSINNEIYFYRDTITNQTYPSFYIANAEGGIKLQQNIQIGKLYFPEMEKSTKEKH